jgi:hypothetical protein
MGRTPDFKVNKTIPDLISDTRKPQVIPETGWYRIAATENYVAQSAGGQYISTLTEAVFRNSWKDVTGVLVTNAPASWYLSADGEVRFRGLITGGSQFSVVCILPEEIRPEYAETFICPIQFGGKANVTIWPDGRMVVDTFS